MKSVFAASALVASAVDLVTFEGDNNWDALIDPVMGGQSVATATIEDEHGVLDGEVKIVPALQAPGFITAQSDVTIDASAAAGGDLVMKVRSSTPDYTGFKVSFAAKTINPTLSCASGGNGPLSRGCFKSPFTVPAGEDFTEIRIPLSEFSDKWDSATGELTTLCKDDPSVCPSADSLKKVQRVAFWGEGKAGQVHIEVDSVAIEPAAALAVPAVGNVRLASFKEEDDEFHTWVQQNDPVMGGASHGTFKVVDDTGVMNGTVALIPALQAPGFIKTSTIDRKAFADISSCTGLELTTKSTSTPSEYTGYRVSFGSDSAFEQCGKFFARGFKADFTAGEGEFKTVQVPFNQFTKCWDDATGDAIHTCEEDSQFCPSSERLADLQTISLWAEGHAADVTLTIQSIDAYGCSNMVVV